MPVTNKDKYLQIFEYLLDFSKKRSNSVRDIENSGSGYVEKLWLNDIPTHDLFENILTTKDFDAEKGYWLKIRKPKEPNKPIFVDLPKNIQIWVEVTTPLNIKEIPVLKETIETQEGVLFIKDFPDIEKEFLDYIQDKWPNDVEDDKLKQQVYTDKLKEYKVLNAIYTKTFRIYNKSQQFGEEYELVMGVGLLNLKQDSNTAKVYRHVIIQGVHVYHGYDAKKNLELFVSPNKDSFPQVEIDSIIDLQPTFDQNLIITAKEEVDRFISSDENEIDAVFNEKIHDALRMFTGRFCAKSSDYVDQIKQPTAEDEKPKTYFSPALLLRKRNTKSLSALYESILENIRNADDDFDIASINDLINDGGDLPHTPQNDNFTDETIFFPLDFNDEQIQIVEKARRSNKVLVQGPPGTGKSHTIANLICDLLAHGNKVLVTAYTQRALEVLKDKLPKEFQDLTVSLLGGDSSSIQGLDKNVNTISREASQADLPKRQQKVEELEQILSETREKKASNINKLIEIKEKSTRKQKINSFYQGTLLEIAEQLEADTDTFKWYKDCFCDIDNTGVTNDLDSFIEFVTEYALLDVSELNCTIPEKSQLPTVTQLSEYRDNLNRLKQRQAPVDEHLVIYNADYKLLASNLQTLANYYVQAKEIRNNATQKLINPYLQANTHQFKEKFKTALSILKHIESIDLKQIDNDIEITYISKKTIKQLKKDAQILLKYMAMNLPQVIQSKN